MDRRRFKDAHGSKSGSYIEFGGNECSKLKRKPGGTWPPVNGHLNIIPKKEVKTVKLNEKRMEWGDNFYPCEPPQYTTDSDIIFEQIKDVKYFSQIVGAELSNDIIISFREDEKIKKRYKIISKDEIGVRLLDSLNCSLLSRQLKNLNFFCQ